MATEQLTRTGDDLEQIEIQLLLEGIFRHYGYDFRGYAPGSLKRRLWHRAYGEKLDSISALQDKVLHDAEVMERAREGAFPLEKMRDYTENYIRAGGTEEFSAYYTAEGAFARFNRDLSDHVVFAQHNLVSDAAFNVFNVIVCRNVMIYFGKALQDRVHELFHDSLETFGVLALGHKESIRFSKHEESYESIDAQEKLYRKTA